MVWLSKQGPHYYVITMVFTNVQGFVSLYVHMHTYIYLHVNMCIHVRSMQSDVPVIVVSWRNIQGFWEHDFILICFLFLTTIWLCILQGVERLLTCLSCLRSRWINWPFILLVSVGNAVFPVRPDASCRDIPITVEVSC